MARTRTTTEIEEISDDERIWPEHPLFPLDEGEKAYEVSWILITRIEEGVQKYGPNVLANELMTEQDIISRFGGGHYSLISRALSKTYDGQPGRFTKHRKLHLPGIPKPLSPDPTPQEQKMANPTMKPDTPVSPMGDPMGMFGIMMQMQQASLERERVASEKAQQHNQQFMQMFMTVMQGSKADSQNMMQMMMTMSSQQQQGMLQFITAMMSNRGGGPEEVAKYAELLKVLGVGQQKEAPKEMGDGHSIGAMLENAADVIQGIVTLKNAGASAGPPPAQPPSELPPGVGGAASLLRGMR
jgi:hypothetical protein